MKGQSRSKAKQSQQAAVTFLSVSEALNALMNSDPESFAWLVGEALDSLATLNPEGFDGLLCALIIRRLQAGNFFITLEELKAHLGRQNFEAATERAGAITAWLSEVERLGALFVQAQQQRRGQSATAHVM